MISKLKFGLFCIQNAIKILGTNQKIDLVTTYDPLTTGLIGLIVSRILKAKFVPEVNGVYTSSANWIDGIESISTKLKRAIIPIIMRFVLKRSDGVKLLFQSQIDPFKEVVNGKIIRIFPNYIPIDMFKNMKEEKEVLFVGFPFKRKGVDILIDAFKKVSPKYPDWKLKILAWLPDPTELRRAIGGHSQIYHHPPVPYHEMPEHIGACAILVLPSRSEAMGRILIEAMAAGKPRIGSNIDGIPTVINEGVDGLLFNPESVDDLSSRLDLLMGAPVLRQRLGRAAGIRAMKEFTEEIYVRNLVSFYNDVLDG